MVIEPRPIVTNFKSDVQYHEFSCVECGELVRNTFCEPHRTQMLDLRLCYMCNYWREEEKRLEREHLTLTIIGGHIYGPGNRTSGVGRGMAGRRFDIEYIEPSAYAGQRVTTFDLWSGSALPEKLRGRFADTARFLGGAHKAQVGETTCWNGSERRADPYPLPQTLKPRAIAATAPAVPS